MQDTPVATGPNTVLPLRAGEQGGFTYNGWGLLNLGFSVVVCSDDITCACMQHSAVHLPSKVLQCQSCSPQHAKHCYSQLQVSKHAGH